MTDSFDWIVVGGGFRSIVAAYGLAKSGQSVALIEAGKSIGGFLSPIRWEKYWIDKGPQFFDNFEQNDLDFFEDMIGSNILEEIGFSYSSFMESKKTDGFAIPDWRSLGETFSNEVFGELLQLHIDQSKSDIQQNCDTLADFISFDGANLLSDKLKQLCAKFLRETPDQLNPSAANMVSFFGRKLLFDQNTSMDLKQSPLIDGFLAAQKVQVGETRYNLYPKGKSLEVVRVAMEEALVRVGVNIILESPVSNIDFRSSEIHCNGISYQFGKLFFGCDIRDSEKILTGGTSILDHTHVLPEIFHCFVVPADRVDSAYYLVDYDTDHLTARITNFCNYMGCVDEQGYGVICAEQPIDFGSDEWENPEKDKGLTYIRV